MNVSFSSHGEYTTSFLAIVSLVEVKSFLVIDTHIILSHGATLSTNPLTIFTNSPERMLNEFLASADIQDLS